MAVGERALCPVLIGRGDELSTLEDSLLDACRGDGRVVVLAGEAGVGKTRLSTELSARAGTIGATVMVGGCSEADIALPYLPFLEALGNWLSVSDIGDVRARLGPSARELAPLFPQLSDEPPVGGDPSQAKLRLFEAILALVRLAAERGLLLILEDLHWADASTRELLDYMTRRLRGVPALVVATYRSDEMHRKHPLLPIVQGWRRSGTAQVVELRPLDAGGVAGMIDAIFSGSGASPELTDFLHERTEGNPFVLEETLKEAIDRGDIYPTEKGWQRKALDEMGVPRSVSDGILARVERLDPVHAEVLRSAAVLGYSFSYEMLAALAEQDESIVQQGLQAAIREQLVVEEARPGRYRFRHALTREAIYEDIILPRRQALHARTADLMSTSPDAPAADIAHHLLAAGRFEEAVPACLKAAGEAVENSASAVGAALYERALPYITDDHLRATTLCKLGGAAFMTQEIETSRTYLETGIAQLESLGEPVEAAHWRQTLGRVHWLAKRPADARREYERSLEILEPLGPSEDLANAYNRIGSMHSFDFEHEECLRLVERAIEVAEAAGADRSRIWAHGFKGLSLVGLGHEEEGFRWMDRSAQESLDRGYVAVAGNALFNSGEMRILSGRAKEAKSSIEGLHRLPPVFPADYSIVLLTGMIEFFQGNLSGAERNFARATEISGRGQSPIWLAWSQSWLSAVLTLQLRLEEARPLLPTIDRSREKQEFVEAHGHHMNFALASGDLESAAEYARVLVAERSWTNVFAPLIAKAVECLAAVGAAEEAAPLVEAMPQGETSSMYPWVLQARGLLAGARGADAEAADLLSRAIEGHRASGYVLSEMDARIALGDDLIEVVAQARACGSAYHERAARKAAQALGIAIEEPSDAAGGGTHAVPAEAAERLVTVMFADVRGYTAMTRSDAPAAMAEKMISFYRWARREIERNRGMVDGYAGDAVMASFNVSEPSLDHCESALAAAIALHEKAALAGLPVGVGIAVGPAVVGRLTGGDNINVIGETTNLAARLQAQAQPGEIVLSDEAYRRTKARLQSEGLSVDERTAELKGLGSVTVFVASPPPPSPHRGLQP